MAQQKPSDRMAHSIVTDNPETSAESDASQKEGDPVPDSPETLDEAKALLAEPDALQSAQTPEQRLQAAAQVTGDPTEQRRLVQMEGDAHPPLAPDENPGERMSRENEALSFIARDLEGHVAAGGLQTAMQAAKVAPEVDINGMRVALQWAVTKLTHPAEQWDFCPQHGKVPVTHMCSIYRNEDYAQALKMIAGVAPAQPLVSDQDA